MKCADALGLRERDVENAKLVTQGGGHDWLFARLSASRFRSAGPEVSHKRVFTLIR